ncbi:MAG: hypothetical protein CM1200mP13_07280 [Candidatus Pelagibacterales bacterium]|nr:MAG: hypothetical protein CM1200mP13_07280 [Pelagibacterales bacterium]
MESNLIRLKFGKKYTNKKIYGAEINSDHFIPEESPKQTINHQKKFFFSKMFKIIPNKKNIGAEIIVNLKDISNKDI